MGKIKDFIIILFVLIATMFIVSIGLKLLINIITWKVTWFVILFEIILVLLISLVNRIMKK